jgi:hypothetical protein
MYKTCAFYTFFHRSSPTKTLVCQGCIKRCIKQKHTIDGTFTATRVLSLAWFLEECLCKLGMYMIFILLEI